MNRAAFLVFCALSVMFLTSCSKALVLEAQKACISEQTPRFSSVCTKETRDAASKADGETLSLILDKASKPQPCTAGSCLRMAALAGELLNWLEMNSGAVSDARLIALAWAEKQQAGTRECAGRTVCLLREAAICMKAEEIRALLSDAGFEISASGPTLDEFLSLAECLSEALSIDYSAKTKKNEYIPFKTLQTAENRAMIFGNIRNIQRMLQ